MQKVTKILLYGLEKSGKTTLIRSFLEGKWVNDVIPTTHRMFDINLEPDIKLEITEVGGDRQTANFATRLLDSVEAIIFVIDGSNEHQFRDVKTEFQKITQHPGSQKKPIAILFNKRDITKVAPTIITKDLDLIKMVDRPFKVFSTTAHDPLETRNVFNWIKERLKEKEQIKDESLSLLEINVLDMLNSNRTLSFISILEQIKIMTRTGYGDYDKEGVLAILRRMMDKEYIEYIEEMQNYKITLKGREKLEE